MAPAFFYMHKLIAKLLQKRGIESLEALDKDEKITFDSWQRILSKQELTTQDIKDFCQRQIEVIEGKWRDLSIDQDKKNEYIPYHTVYKTLLEAIDSPQDARIALEQQLNQLINN